MHSSSIYRRFSYGAHILGAVCTMAWAGLNPTPAPFGYLDQVRRLDLRHPASRD